MTTRTYVERLRALSNDRARGLWCIAKAEQARHAYHLGLLAAQELEAQKAGRRTAVTDARGGSAWGSTAEARDLRQNGVMFGQWADTYLAAYNAYVLAMRFDQDLIEGD